MSAYIATDRVPINLTGDDWVEAIEMLCYMCADFLDCDVCEEMIERKNEDQPVANGFATDPGSEITCLSYRPKGCLPLTDDKLKEFIAGSKGKDMCGGCAARKGSAASNSLHTQRDFSKSVQSKTLFSCHEGRKGPCIGWCRAIDKSNA